MTQPKKIREMISEAHEQFMATKKFIESVGELEASKDNAYKERDQLVALLSKIFGGCLARHPDEDETWDNDWRWIVFMDLPTGQASWHIHDSELPLFSHLPQKDIKWDGHSTEEKYQRIKDINRSVLNKWHFPFQFDIHTITDDSERMPLSEMLAPPAYIRGFIPDWILQKIKKLEYRANRDDCRELDKIEESNDG